MGSDIADEYISALKFKGAELLRDKIDPAIAAAVQAEREACAKVAIDLVYTEPYNIAAAIRARNGAGRE